MEYFLDKVDIKDKDILYRLLQYSLFEESLNDGNEMNLNAIFEYKYFDRYFTDTDRIAYFIKDKSDNKLLGFVMINTYMQKYEDGHSIAEFMVIPKYRKNKIGKRVAFECFDMYKGNWTIKAVPSSPIAENFWTKTVANYTNGNFKIEHTGKYARAELYFSNK